MTFFILSLFITFIIIFRFALLPIWNSSWSLIISKSYITKIHKTFEILTMGYYLNYNTIILVDKEDDINNILFDSNLIKG